METNFFINGIEFINVEFYGRSGGRKPLKKNDIYVHLDVDNKNQSSTIIRFSSSLKVIFSEYNTVSLARNNVTGDVFLVFFKGGKGNVPIRFECKKREKGGTYPVIGIGKFVRAFLTAMNVPLKGNICRYFSVSDNLSNNDDYFTLRVMPKTNE